MNEYKENNTKRCAFPSLLSSIQVLGIGIKGCQSAFLGSTLTCYFRSTWNYFFFVRSARILPKFSQPLIKMRFTDQPFSSIAMNCSVWFQAFLVVENEMIHFNWSLTRFFKLGQRDEGGLIDFLFKHLGSFLGSLFTQHHKGFDETPVYHVVSLNNLLLDLKILEIC